jgi:hypothetical protein
MILVERGISTPLPSNYWELIRRARALIADILTAPQKVEGGEAEGLCAHLLSECPAGSARL